MSELGSLVIAGLALILSVFSYYFSIRSWRESNRPIVTVRISTFVSGNVATLLNLVVENTGNRPAKNIKLSVDQQELAAAFLADPSKTNRKIIEGCFAADTIIPVLTHGKTISNSFGALSQSPNVADWKRNARFNVVVQYQDLDDRRYKHRILLVVTTDEGFAGAFWQHERQPRSNKEDA